MDIQIDTVSVESFKVEGLPLRTCNANEFNPDTASIPQHVQYVDENVEIDYSSGARAYSVYCHYESDVNGFYDIIMGSNEVASTKLPLTSIDIQAGNYLKFTSSGEFPGAIIEAWTAVWNYFNQANSPHTRAYTTDFEHYEGPNTVSIYVALK